MERYFYKMRRDAYKRECSFYFDSDKEQPKEMFGADLVRVEELNSKVYFSKARGKEEWGVFDNIKD